MNKSSALAWRVILASILLQRIALAEGKEPLHAVIDRCLAPMAGMEPRRSTDAEFLRRVSLDLVGMPPTADEARAFIADSASDKRERLIDRLFESPQYARHLAAALDVMLMERRGNTHVSADEWQAWLLKSVRENKPWNVLAREILEADGEDPAKRPAARFALDRASDPHVLTRDIGRIFFGRDMQCAQCHDHPLVADYLQSDYHGLLAFVAPCFALVRNADGKQTTLQAERAGTDLTFESVFEKVPRRTGARMPDGTTIDEPFLLPGEEYEVAPADNVKPVPKFSRRKMLAEMATNGLNQAFNWNIVNRLWAHMFGRGLVHPVDMQHADNPPSNPELLRQLSEHFVVMNFDIRAFLREIALSAAYQRSYDAPEEILVEASALAAAEVARLEKGRIPLAEAADKSSEEYGRASEAWQDAEAAMLPVAGELDTARNQYAEAKKKMDEAVKAVADTTTQLQGKQKVVDPLQAAANAAQEAIKALPEDKELADATQKFVARSQQLAAEVEALTKSKDEKTAAVAPATEAWNNSKPPVEAARTKVTPLTTAMREAEKKMLAARTKAAMDAQSLAAIDRRLETARRITQITPLKEAIAAANEQVPVRESELAAAQKQLNDFAPVVTEAEGKVKAATEALTAATDTLTAARAEHEKRADVSKAIVAAFEAAEAARQKVPDDAALTDAAAKLQERAAVSNTAAAESQKQVDAAVAAEQAAGEALAAVHKSLAEAGAERDRRAKALEAATKALADAKVQVVTKQGEFDAAVADVTDRWTRDFTVASLKPLSPEQLCWSVFRATGVYDRHWQAEVAELDKSKPLSDEQKRDSAQLAARQIELEQRAFDKLKGNVATFVAFYGAAAGQPQSDFFATADQALFAANGGSVNSWVAAAADNVTDRMTKQTDLRAGAEELYLAVLTRLPTEEEANEVVNVLTSRASDKGTAAQELVWALLNSAEFRFNH